MSTLSLPPLNSLNRKVLSEGVDASDTVPIEIWKKTVLYLLRRGHVSENTLIQLLWIYWSKFNPPYTDDGDDDIDWEFIYTQLIDIDVLQVKELPKRHSIIKG